MHSDRIDETRRPHGPFKDQYEAQNSHIAAPWRETHAYIDRHVESENSAPTCTNSTIIVDVVSVDTNISDRDSSIRPIVDQNATGSPTDNGISDLNAIDIAKYDKDETANYHVYEEVGLFDDSETRTKNEIQNCCDKCNLETTKPSIHVFLPSHKICGQCMSINGSPVIYSDRLIFKKQKIFAIEGTFLQQELSPSYMLLRYINLLDSPHTDYMLVLNLIKANASGILYYSRSVLRDFFALELTLRPDIILLNSSKDSNESNTQVYHRFVNNYYSRISKIAVHQPMIFRRSKPSRMFSTIKSTGYDENMIYWMNYDNELKMQHQSINDHDEQLPLSIAEAHQTNRSSLLLLEPLLLMPEFASPRPNLAKNRITHSEHVKIVRMVIAYTLSFFLLAIITFYIVYFT